MTGGGQGTPAKHQRVKFKAHSTKWGITLTDVGGLFSFLLPYSKNERNSMERRVRWRVFLCVKVTYLCLQNVLTNQRRTVYFNTLLGRTSRISMRLGFLPSILDTLSWLSILSFFCISSCLRNMRLVLRPSTYPSGCRPSSLQNQPYNFAITLLQPLPPCSFGISPTRQSEISTTGQLPFKHNEAYLLIIYISTC